MELGTVLWEALFTGSAGGGIRLAAVAAAVAAATADTAAAEAVFDGLVLLSSLDPLRLQYEMQTTVVTWIKTKLTTSQLK